MSEEKILAFLNLKKGQKVDGVIMKAMTIFDVAFTICIIGCGFLFECITFSGFNIAIVSSLLVSAVLFVIWYKTLKNPAREITSAFIVLLASFLKLLYGYKIFSRGEALQFGYPTFGPAYVIMLIVFLGVGIYMCVRFYEAYRDLKSNTIEYLQKKLRKTREPKWLILTVYLAVAYIVLSKGSTKLGVGFGFWGLACAWLCIALMALPKCIVTWKYKAYKYFENEEEIQEEL